MWQDKLSRIYVGAWRNFCSQAHRNATARFGGVARFGFFTKLRGRDVEGAVPYRFVAVILWFCTIFIQFSSFKQGAGSAFLCDQNLSSCSPNSRPQNVSSYTATLQDIRFGIISLYLSRKSPLLLHKKCNNCRNVAKLKDKSFVCTNYDVINCAVSHIRS